MKKYIVITLFAALTLGSCQTDSKEQSVQEVEASIKNPNLRSEVKTPIDTVNIGKFEFKEENNTYDFGTVDEGEQVEYFFEFTNTGKEPLVIQSANGSCGCTVPEPPKDPVQVGETAKIKVKFNSKGRPGPTHKTVTLVANTNPVKTVLHLKGKVNPEKKK